MFLNKIILFLTINKYFALKIFLSFITISLKEIYISPSKLQAIKFKKNILNNWSSLENEIVCKVALNSKSKPIIFDIGSNIGVSLLGYAKNFQNYRLASNFDYRLVGFEPFEPNFKYFQYNTKNFNRISLIKMGISDENKMISFMIPDYVKKGKDINNTGFISAKIELFKDNYNSTYNFQVKKLDSFTNLINKNENLVFMKIDVEGFEKKVLLGAVKTLERYRPVLLIEKNINTNSKDDILSILKLVYSLNYKTFFSNNFSMDQNGYIWAVHQGSENIVKLISKHFKEFKI